MQFWKHLAPPVPQRLNLGFAHGMTDRGIARATNEDNFLIDAALGLVALADGMGGHQGGALASATSLSTLSHFIERIMGTRGAQSGLNFKPSDFDPFDADPEADWTDATTGAMITLHEALEFTNQRIYLSNLEQQRNDGSGMGTTLTGLWQAGPDGPVLLFHVGDSRLYRLRNGQLRQITHDHTVHQQARDLGLTHDLPARHMLLQAVGPSAAIKPQLQMLATMPGDLYVLCSDGLYAASTDERILQVLQASAMDWIEQRCAQLIEMAKQDGSRDNITVALIQC